MSADTIVTSKPASKIGLRGWLVIGAATLVFVGLYGAQMSFSVFLKPLSEGMEWSRAATAAGLSVLQITFGFFGIVTGMLADRYGARKIIAAGAVIGIAGYLLMSTATQVWHLYLYFGVMVGTAMACLWVPITAMISHRFPEQRVLALGITTTGITIGQMTVAPLAAWVIGAAGWQQAYLVLALVAAVVIVPAFFMLGEPKGGTHAQVNAAQMAGQRQWRTREALKTLPLWMLLVMGFAISAGYYFVIAHIVAFATDTITGLAAQSATLILIVMGAASIVGKVAVSPLTTRIGNRNTLFVVIGLQTVALFSFLFAHNLWALFAASAVFGLGFGATSPVRTSMIPELFGLSSVGALIGVVNVAWALGGMTGPFFAGYIYDVSHSYQVAFLVGGTLVFGGIVATYFLHEPKAPENKSQ